MGCPWVRSVVGRTVCDQYSQAEILYFVLGLHALCNVNHIFRSNTLINDRMFLIKKSQPRGQSWPSGTACHPIGEPRGTCWWRPITMLLASMDSPLLWKPSINTWWRHQMEHFPRYWPFVMGIHRSPVDSPHKEQWRGASMFSLIYAWTNG